MGFYGNHEPETVAAVQDPEPYQPTEADWRDYAENQKLAIIAENLDEQRRDMLTGFVSELRELSRRFRDAQRSRLADVPVFSDAEKRAEVRGMARTWGVAALSVDEKVEAVERLLRGEG